MPGSITDWPETVSASELTTKNQPPDTDIIMFQISGLAEKGSSSRQKRCQVDRWNISAASFMSCGTVRRL